MGIFLNDNHMKASYSIIKNKMLELTRLFCVEDNVFQKFVIIYQYITLLDKDPLTKKILQKMFDRTVKNFGEIESCLNEENFLNINSDVIRTQEFWLYYNNLKIIYSKMKIIKKHCSCKVEDIDDICRLFSRPYSASALELSFKVINSNIFEEIDQKCFLEGEDKVKTTLSFDMKESTLWINDCKIVISRQSRETNSDKILNYIIKINAKNLNDEFYFSEIAEHEFGEFDYKNRYNNWKRYYKACENINNKILEQSNFKITNFLIYNSGTKGRVKINQKYL